MSRGLRLALRTLLLLWIALLLGLLARTSLAQPAPAAGGRLLRVATQLEPPVLDPTSSPAAAITEITYGNLFEGLLVLGEDGEPRPRLASAWQISDDGLTLRFTLRTGVRFHDGQPFDAASARFSLERARAPGSANPMRSALAAIARISTPDAQTLVLQLTRRAGGLLQTLASGALVMVSPASADDNKTRPVGTGPFRFVDWRRGDSLRLARNAHYWGGAPALAGLSYRFIADPSAAYAALMAGDLDLFSNFPSPENLAQFRADRRFAVDVGSSEGETLLAMNHRHAPLDRLAVRQALGHALDRRALIDGAMFGYGEPIGSHFPPRNAAYVDLTAQSAYDPALARRLLREAGVQDLTLSLKLPPTTYARRSGEIIAAQLAQVGVRVHIEQLEWAQWLDQVYTRHDFDLSVIVHAEPLDYDIYARPDYYFGYRSAAFDALLRELDDATDPARRRTLLQAVQRRLADDAANGFLFQYPRLVVRRAALTGLASNGVGSLEFAQARLAGDDGARPATGHGGAARRLGLALALIAAALLALLLRRADPAWLLRRLLGLVLTLLGASVIVFVLVQLAPGDPARYMLGVQADAQAVARLRAELGLDAPALARYGQWLAGLLHGDLGQSYTYRVPVTQLVAERLPLSLPLAGLALLLAVLIALPAGLAAALRPRGRLDSAIDALSQLGLALPNFWLGLLLAWVFAQLLRWVPAGGFPGWDAGLGAALASLALPALALALPQAAILTRVLRGELVDLQHADYLRTARAKGAGRWRTLWRHALPNAALPVLTLLGLQFSFLLAGAVIIENVFFLPGLGRLLFQAITQRDLLLVQSLVLVLVAGVVAVSFVVELASRAADPRLARHGSAA